MNRTTCLADYIDDEEDVEESTPYLHVYPQKKIHETLVILGTHTALIKLHKAITCAITKWFGHSDGCFCGDGEWFSISVKDTGEENLEGSLLPYRNKRS